MALPGDSSDTLISPPSPVYHPKPKATLMESDLELSTLESPPPPLIPKLFREASDITWQETLESTKDQVPLVRRRGRFRLLHQQQFKNSLLASVGYLELANAGDFAANVWNDIPVPTFAAVLMGIGGTLALFMVLVAIQDFRLSWRNVKLLREERVHIQRLQQYHCKNPELTRLLDARLGVGEREIGTEVVDRIVMDMLMGFANPRVYEASNLLSGWIGNAMAALFGLANAIWSLYLIRRFRQHDKAVVAREPSDDIRRRLRLRFRRFQLHSIVNSLNGLVAGAASMVTAKHWEGYVVLIPCIISLIMCNYFWRKKLGYDRPILDHISLAKLQLTPLLEDLEYAIAMQRGLAEPKESFPLQIFDTESLDSMLRFIVRNRMLETYVESLAHDKRARFLLSEIPSTGSIDSPDEIVISFDVLIRLSISHPTHSRLLLDHAAKFLREEGVRIFTHCERHLLELLGYAVWRDQTATEATGAIESR
ncbi:uncharacterized protein N7484_007992 [Penicillium longicatenatum]|uniref:uncharacterized protein n=1 Tax=Penicillium longicatenatum TaxID=1561947 RepID=UPI002548FCFE|nr:uncharacterized protein N7484_007992 [Penicillium longicatenatum]KAJ5640130.1 hypothetical protein N7484_007992 [Penicillium longicatenatum]